MQKTAMENLDESRKAVYRLTKAGELEWKKMTVNCLKKLFISEGSMYDNKVITESVDI
ncbi:MAG: hypothetical protein ACOC1M_06930 [Halanaerobium sp.]